ncbi:DUF4091 domain-containing protein [Niabella yanshanensis]|uniref:DUF4091 domain-containing protein n=1 Tax=Niabella yanshanensis TaxID=577386 RepID=A0ABZ0W7J4_9BACT|nr:glycoside hydrolase domain-containing protein [Niabella yanshanensis]WQD38919.1 DUF4091 domain-containing protein [Niabella yanshanensis]
MLKSNFLLLFISLYVQSLAQDISLALQKTPRLTEVQRMQKWDAMQEDVTVSFASSSTRFTKELPSGVVKKTAWELSGWKNEKLHVQILAATKIDLKGMTVAAGDLRNETGDVLKKEQLSLGFIQYVITDEFRDGCGHRKSVDFDSSMVADIINTELRSMDVSKHTTQPVWLTIQIPGKQPAGKYTGTISVTAGKTYKLQLILTIADRTLPAPKDWSFQLDYWQHPAAIARVHRVKLWSAAHFEQMRKYYTMLANAGQKVITASIVDEPWGHQTYDDYPGLIKWTKKKNGTWTYDYSLFDKYIDFVMSCGIRNRINCYSMVPWKIAFKYYDEASQKDTVFTGAIGNPEYNEFWRTMLVDFTAHLKKKGWFGITTIAMDERPMRAMQSVISLLKTVDPAWKISLAGEWHPEIEKDIYDYCIASKWAFPDAILKERKQAGKTSTWYTCCTEKYPNMFTFSPPDEGVWAGWYTAASGMDGFLRWAYNSWTRSPLTDSRFTAWPAGDTYQVYPGPLSSVRFEKLIEGVQDFEKINALRKSYQMKNETIKLKELEAALQTFTIEKLSQQSAQEMVEKYKHLLN